MTFYLYLKNGCCNSTLEKLFEVAQYFKENEENILYNSKCLYPRLKETKKRGNAALNEIFDNIKNDKIKLEDLNNYVKLTRRNENLFMGDYMQLTKIDKVKEIIGDDLEESVYCGNEPYKYELVKEEKIEDRMNLIKDIIKDENYNFKELHDLSKYILDLMLDIQNNFIKDFKNDEGLPFTVE